MTSDDLLARMGEALVPLVLDCLATTGAACRKTFGDTPPQSLADAPCHLGSHSWVVNDVEDATLEPPQVQSPSGWSGSASCGSPAFGNHCARSTKSAYRLSVCLWMRVSFDSLLHESIREFSRSR